LGDILIKRYTQVIQHDSVADTKTTACVAVMPIWNIVLFVLATCMLYGLLGKASLSFAPRKCEKKSMFHSFSIPMNK